MIVKDLMTRDPATCTPSSSLDHAAALMWHYDVGCIPVVERERGRLVGVITDRDALMASWSRGKPLTALRVSDVMATRPYTVAENDPIDAAASLMRLHQLNRLPVVDGAGRVTGIITLKDLAITGVKRGMKTDVVATLQAIGAPRPHAPPASAARPARV